MFIPSSWVWDHTFHLYWVSKQLEHRFNILYVTCDSALVSSCTPQYYAGLDYGSSEEQKLALCIECKARRDLLKSFIKGRHLSINTFISEGDREEASGILEALKADEVASLEYKGVPIGKFSLIDHIIFRRKKSITLDDVDFERIKALLLSEMISVSSLQKIIHKENPDSILVYNGLYPVEHCLTHLARRRGITTYFLHAGPNWHRIGETLDLGHSDIYKHSVNLKEYWARNNESIDFSRKNIRALIQHYKSLILNTSGYDLSQRKNFHIDLTQRIGRKPETKLVLVAVSSYDEYLGAFASGALDFEPTIFETQLNWLKAIVCFAKSNDRYHFVIRIHPREYKIDRFGKGSQVLPDLTECLQDRSDNVYVNQPSDGLSLFDFVPDVDLLLTSWSTVSEDFACLGVPVLSYYRKVLMFPEELVTVCQTTVDEYFDAVKALAEGYWSVDNAAKAARWRVLRLHEVVYKMPSWYVSSNNRSIFTRILLRLFKFIDGLLIERFHLALSRLPFRRSTEIVSVIYTGRAVVRFGSQPERPRNPSGFDCVNVEYFLRIIFEELLRMNWNEVKSRKFNLQNTTSP